MKSTTMNQTQAAAVVSEFKAWVAESKRLRTLSSEAEAEFLSHLQEGEDNPSLWQRVGYTTFFEVLDGENLCLPARYNAFKAAVAQIGFDKVREIGVDSARLVLAIPAASTSRCDENKTAVSAVIADLSEFRRRNATPPSERQARAIRAKHWDAPTKPKLDANAHMHALEDENKALRKEVKALRHENERLKRAGQTCERGSSEEMIGIARGHRTY